MSVSVAQKGMSATFLNSSTLLHSERPKLYEILAFLSTIGLTTKKQTTKVSSENVQKNVKSKLYHIENSKTRGQTV